MSWFFYVYEGTEWQRPGMTVRVASGCAPTREDAEREGRHYLAQYQQDGDHFLVIRKSPTKRNEVRP